MICSRELIEGYLDEELDPAARAQVEEHLASCPDCAETSAKLRSLKAGIRAEAPYYEAPAELRQSVQAALRRAAREESATVRMPVWRYAGIAAALLLVASLGWMGGRYTGRAPQDDLLAQTLVASHIRSLIGTHLMDVVSTDQHTVKPWFNGKLDFSPDARDLASDGFPLLGGRVDYVSNRAVAVLVYGRRQHVINLYEWPDTAAERETRFARNGYNVIHWTHDGTTYWAASDVSFPELERFRALH